MAISSLLVGTTTGSGCDYWQTTSHISTAPGSNTTVNRCAINTPYTAILLTSINDQVGVYESTIYFCSVFFVYCTGVVMLVSHSRWRKVLGQGFQKAHCVLFKLWITHTVWAPLHLIEYSVTLACTLYIHIRTHHTSKLEGTHRSQESNTCTRTALEPQQSAAVLMGATCCYCGLSGKAGLLPALQPAATEWTQYPDRQSHGLQASGPSPALLSADLSIIHLSGFSPGGHPIQCKSVSCSKDATQWACHWDTEDSPMCLWQEAESQADITTLLPSLQIDTMLLLSFLLPLG